MPLAAACPPAAAQVVTCGDIGHPASVLCKRFPELAGPLGALPELWWYAGKPGKPNCALQKRFESHETQHQVDVSAGQCVRLRAAMRLQCNHTHCRLARLHLTWPAPPCRPPCAGAGGRVPPLAVGAA